jgi:hypothetical protein
VTGTASVEIDASLDTSTETVMTYTNDVVGLKVCKVWSPDGGAVPSPWNTVEFPFTVTPATDSVLGPVPAPYSFSLLAGTKEHPVCSSPVDYRPGTLVTISEGIVPGSKVESIATDGNGETIVTGFPSITGRTIEILVGTGVASSLSTPVDEAVVTFANETADPGELEICKDAGTPAPVGTLFSFTVSGTTGTTTVPVGGCAVVGGSLDPTQFPFNSTQTVTELASSGNATSAISVSPTYVTENATLTSELVMGATTGIGTTTDVASSVAVVIGEDTMTQVTFTDTDPPAGSSVGGPPAVVSNPGGSNAGTTIGVTASVASLVSTSVSKSTGNAVTRELRRDEALLATIKLEIKMNERALAKAHGAVHLHLSKRLSALMARERALLKEINFLK